MLFITIRDIVCFKDGGGIRRLNVNEPNSYGVIESMFDKGGGEKKLFFSKNTCAAFLFFGRKSASQSFAPHALASLLLKFVLVCFCLAFVSCANAFQDKVSVSSGGNTSTLGDVFVSAEVVGKLDTPSEIHVSLYEFKDKIRVSWSPVKHAAYYTLERLVVTEKSESGEWVIPEDAEFSVLEHTQQLYSTSYTDTIIKEGLNDPLDYTNEKYGYAYFYRVCAENPRLGYEESDEKLSSCGSLLPPPSGTKATAGESEKYIEITWNQSAGAVRYEIYRSEREDGTNSAKVGTVTAGSASYKDDKVSSFKGSDLFYTVSSINMIGEKSVVGPVALGYTLLPGAPGAVQNVRVKSGHGESAKSIEIEWEPSEESSEDGEITYTVYRSSSESSTMKKLKDKILSTTCSYSDSNGLKQNVYYYYYVQPSKERKDEDGKVVETLKGTMSKSGPESANPAEGFILSPPSTVEVQKILGDSSKCRINFTPVIGDKNFSDNPRDYKISYTYVVYGGNSIGGTFGEIARRSEPEFANGKYSMEVPANPFYKVGVEFNNEKSSQTDVYAPAPYAARDVYVTRAQMIEDYSQYVPANTTSNTEPGTNSNGVHAVKITWKAPEGGAVSYNIYRSEKRESGFKKITETPVSGDKTEYIDRNDAAKAGTIYYYYVLSLNSLGQGANKSEIDAPTLENGIIKTKNADGSACGRGWGWGALSAWQYMREQRKTVESSQKKLTLMHKPNNLDKVGSETINGDISGTLGYTAKVDGLGARITMPYANYADSYIGNNKDLGIYFLFDGDTNTSSNMSANGKMDGVVTCRGMYPGKVRYDNVEIKSGNAGGGYYGVIRDGIDSNEVNVDYKAGNK